MNIRKFSMVFVFVVIPALAAFVIAAERKSDDETVGIPQSPGIILPGDQDSGTLSIVPEERDSAKIQYRNILYGQTDTGDNDNQTGQYRQYEQPGPDQDKGLRDPDDPMNKAYPLPPGTDQARKLESDPDSSVVPMKDEDRDPSVRPTMRNGSPASRSNSYLLQYVVDEPLGKCFTQNPHESMNSRPMSEEFSADRDLGDSDSPDIGDSREFNMPSDQDGPRDPGMSL